MKNVDLLENLSNQFGVSGFEDDVRNWITEAVKDVADDIAIDILGNLIVRINPGKDFTLMLDAHMDEIGLMISHVEEKGFLRFALIGGWDPRVLPGQRVDMRSRTGKKLRGAIGALPPHVQTPEEQKQPLKVEDLYIDMGAESKEAVTEMGIGPGTPGTVAYPFQILSQHRVMGKALDDRVGCAVLIQSLEYFSKNRPDFSVIANFAVSEEVGYRGAKTASYEIRPDVALVVEGTTGADTPGTPEHKCPARLSKGPAISVADKSIIVNPAFVTFIEQAANKLKIPWQHKAPLSGGTDAGAIHLSRGGVLTGIISIPCRYIHSPSSVVDLRDYEHAVALVIEVARRAPEIMKAAL
ncbi:MAG: M20/M25/M40 family metallo-hydrolase [Proteobacteria bacterium]|nr:M20/M25/M40 family metallo-hydrolase [Pseudomonadota bacterium]